MHLVEAKTLKLMGRAESWDCHGGHALGACPDKVLKAAQRFFQSTIRAEGKNARMSEQLAAIALILRDRETNSPQGALAL